MFDNFWTTLKFRMKFCKCEPNTKYHCHNIFLSLRWNITIVQTFDCVRLDMFKAPEMDGSIFNNFNRVNFFECQFYGQLPVSSLDWTIFYVFVKFISKKTIVIYFLPKGYCKPNSDTDIFSGILFENKWGMLHTTTSCIKRTAVVCYINSHQVKLIPNCDFGLLVQQNFLWNAEYEVTPDDVIRWNWKFAYLCVIIWCYFVPNFSFLRESVCEL